MAIQQFTAGQTLTANAMNTLQASDYNYTRKIITTSSYTTVLEDRGQLLEFQNAGGTTVTIPLNSSVAYTTGDVLEIVNGSTATVTIVGDTGVTIEATGDITSLTSEWQKCQLVKRETNNWLLTGITSVAILDSVITDADVSPSAAIAKTKIAGTAITAADTGTVTSTMIADGTIVNADINASAAIDKTKISGTAITAADTGTVTSAMIADGTIVNGDISASAAIDKTKISGTAITAADSGTVTSTMIADGTIVNADINASAAIDKTKISGTAITAADSGTVTSTMIADGTIVNGDINASAAIALSKLATGSSGQLVVHNSSGVPTATTVTGDVTIDSSGVVAIASGAVVNADINSSAAIAYSKLNLASSIVNADVSSSAAIALSKIADASIDEKSSNYVLTLTDKNKFIKMNIASSANTVTVPLNSSEAFPVGSQIHIIQYGTGKTQVVPVSGSVFVYGTPGTYLRAQYSTATLLKCDTNTWLLMGDLSAS